MNGYSATLSRDPEYLNVLEGTSTVPLADGFPLIFGARLTSQGGVSRCPGPDLMDHAADRAAIDGTSFFLLGGAGGVAEDLAVALKLRHPGLRIAGTLSPPFGEWDEVISRELVAAVVDSGAEIVWLGVSAPKQEIWAGQWVHDIGRPVVCVGAAFDFLSGRKPRCPTLDASLRP